MDYVWDITNKKTYNNRTGHYKFEKEYTFIKNHITDKIESILDVCGGSGRLAIPLLDFCKDITLIDKNKEAIEILKKRTDKIKVICADFSQYATTQRKTYDLILCIEAFRNFENQNQFFEKINKMLAENGTFIFTSLNPKSWRFYLRHIHRHYFMKSSAKYYDLNIKELEKMINKRNLKIEKIEGMNWIPLPLTSNSRLVPFFVFIEQKLNLHKWINQSPMWLIAVRKNADYQ